LPQPHADAAAASSEPVPLPACPVLGANFWSDRSPPDSAKNSYEQLEKRLTGFLTSGESLKPYSNNREAPFTSRS
jgi:hypothetical protein